MDFSNHETFTARVIVDGYLMRPGNPPTPGYILYTLESGKRIFVDPKIPESAHVGIADTVQAAELAEIAEIEKPNESNLLTGVKKLWLQAQKLTKNQQAA